MKRASILLMVLACAARRSPALLGRLTLAVGSSVVQLRLRAKIKRLGTYKMVWTILAGTKKLTRTTAVALRR